MRRLAAILCAAAATLVSSYAAAQDFTLTDAVAFARANAPQGRSVALLLAANRAQRDELRAGYLPSLNVAGLLTAGFSGSGSNLGVRGMIGSPFVNQWAVGLEGSWSVLDFTRIEPRVAAVEADASALRAERARTERDVALAVLDTFERALAVEANISALDEDLRARRVHLEAMRSLAAAGTIALADLLQIEAGIARGETGRVMLSAESEAARAALRVLTGQSRSASARLLIDAPPRGDVAPEAAMLAARREQARRVRDIAWREVLPRVIVGGSVGYASAAPPREPGAWAVGVAVVVPLTTFFAERARQETVALTAEARGEEAIARAQQMAVQISELAAMLRGLEASRAPADASVRAARLALDAMEARARGGLVREVEIEAARVALAQATAQRAVLAIRAQAMRARLAILGAR